MEDVELVPFSFERDMEDILRMWTETGWFDGEDRERQYIESFFQANDGRSVVARLNGQAESVVHRALGTMHFDQTQVSLGGITAVTTSRIARRLRFASRLTARTVAHLADEGAAVALLGMFEQGFYDRFGFGVGSYENRVFVYPGDLNVPVPYRTPERFDFDEQIEEIHEAMVNRMPSHGGIVVGGERFTKSGTQIDQELHTYGYRTDGVLTHFISVETKGENGPDRVVAMAYENKAQCLELLRLLQEWGDQVDCIRFVEPVWMQAQDFMVQPGHEYRRTKGTPNAMRIDADAWWQFRIVDLDACVKAMRPSPNDFSIIVQLEDPIGPHLLDSGYEGEWRQLTGAWKLSFGSVRGAERVPHGAEPELQTSVNALSRWWLGVVSANTLHSMGQFDAQADVLDALDALTVHLPTPQVGWDI